MDVAASPENLSTGSILLHWASVIKVIIHQQIYLSAVSRQHSSAGLSWRLGFHDDDVILTRSVSAYFNPNVHL